MEDAPLAFVPNLLTIGQANNRANHLGDKKGNDIYPNCLRGLKHTAGDRDSKAITLLYVLKGP